MDLEPKIKDFLENQLKNADFLNRNHIFYENGSRKPSRKVFYELQDNLHNFLEHRSDARSFILTGLRGTGKTTLLSQLFHSLQTQSNPCEDIYSVKNKLFIPVDRLVKDLGASLSDLLAAYEYFLDTSFERLEEPLVLFLDEVQYDPRWGITLKSLYDRSSKIFVFATGSSALLLHSNADIARRSDFKKIFPISFKEYAEIKHNLKVEETLSKSLKEAIFHSASAEDLFNRLKKLEKQVFNFWIGIERFEVERYLNYGSLPYTLTINDESLIYDRIEKTIDRIVNMDLYEYGKFEHAILAKISPLLYSIAESENFSLSSAATSLGLSRQTVVEVLDCLEKSEALVRLYSYGSHNSQIRKISKFFFSAPAFRSTYFKLLSSVRSEYLGKVLEDVLIMYCKELFYKHSRFSLTYGGNSDHSADFVLLLDEEKIVIEVGIGKKDFKQVSTTMKKVKAKYGINISKAPLKLSKEKQAVSIPLEYFFLL